MDEPNTPKPSALKVLPDNIPESLKAIPQWLMWKYVFVTEVWDAKKKVNTPCPGKWSKVPFDVKTNRHAASSKPETWAPYELCIGAYLRNPGKWDGIGICFFEGDGLVGIDLDKCYDASTGEITQDAGRVLAQFAYTYSEISPSGNGFRIFCHGNLKKPGQNVGKPKWAEIYDWRSPRYLTVTGNHWIGAARELTEQTVALDWVHAAYFEKAKAEAKPALPVKASLDTPKLALSDAELLKKAFTSKNGDKFTSLWYATTNEHVKPDGALDRSTAAASLCAMLCFWTRGDATAMDRLFRQSTLGQLCVDKWDRQHSTDGRTWGQMTIDHALEKNTTYYEPDHNRPANQQGKGKAKSAGGENVPPDLPPLDDDGGIGGGYHRPQKKNAEDDRPEIQIGGDKLVSAMQEAERELFKDKIPPFFQRGGLLIRMAPVDQLPQGNSKIKRPVGSIMLTPVTSGWLRRRMMQYCKFTRWFKADNEYIPVNLPTEYADSYLESGDWWAPILKCVVHTPLMRSDGSILNKPGFDAKSGIYLASDLKVEMPPERKKGETIDPSKDKAVVWAYHVFEKLFSSFEVETPADLSVLVATVLSGLVTSEEVRSPGIVITAPVKGTGKGKLASVISMILTGAPAPKLTMTDDLREFRKTLFAALLAGDRMICMDEVEHAINSAVLNSILTEEVITDRVLQVSKMATVRTTDTLFIALGNNVEVTKDGTRRWLRCYLRPKHPEPHKRVFDHDPVKQALEHQATIIKAGLTILSAFVHVGMPKMTKDGLGSYEGWNKWIRQAVIWAGMGDPVQTMEQWKQQDTSSLQSAGLLTAWYRRYGDTPKTVGEVLKDINNEQTETSSIKDLQRAIDLIRPIEPGFCPNLDDLTKELREILDEICYDKKKKDFNGNILGHRIKKENKRQTLCEIGNSLIYLRFEEAGVQHNSKKWEVKATMD